MDILFQSLTDVIGVVKNAEDLVTVNTKSNRQVNKRDINLVDDSGRIVRLTLWGTNVSLLLKLFYYDYAKKLQTLAVKFVIG